MLGRYYAGVDRRDQQHDRSDHFWDVRCDACGDGGRLRVYCDDSLSECQCLHVKSKKCTGTAGNADTVFCVFFCDGFYAADFTYSGLGKIRQGKNFSLFCFSLIGTWGVGSDGAGFAIGIR